MSSPVLAIQALDFHWQTIDPFLFCAFHQDDFPKGNGEMGPDASLAGRHIGQDFEKRDGWRMYHGDRVPGFPGHPHRGFETITIVQHGLVDHADSLGAAGRYGEGDVQWLTTGRGVQHSEMFPLVHQDGPNPLLLFQIWLNLPAANKMAEPNFTMFWGKDIPKLEFTDEQGKYTRLELVAGDFDQARAPTPPPDSWAADPANHVAVWLVEIEAGGHWTLPAAAAGLNRMLYFYGGDTLNAAGQQIPVSHGLRLAPDQPLSLTAGDKPAHLLLLQGKPIAEPVAHYGPFVMNTRDELQQAFMDYQRTQFGGWPWERHDQVHGDRPRFARYADGTEEEPA